MDRSWVWIGSTASTQVEERESAGNQTFCCTFAQARAPVGRRRPLLWASEARVLSPSGLSMLSPHTATCVDGCANPLQTVWHRLACRDQLSLLNEQLYVCNSFSLHREIALCRFLPSDGNVYLPQGQTLFFGGNVCWCSPPLVGANPELKCGQEEAAVGACMIAIRAAICQCLCLQPACEQAAGR